MKKILGIIAIIILALGVYQIIKKENTKQALVGVDQEINIGALLSLSGAGVRDGEALRDGINLAVRDLKEENVKVNISLIDDGTEIKETVSGMNLLASQGVDAVIGPTWSFLYSAAMPVATREKIVSMGPAVTSEYSQKGDYGFQLAPLVSNSNKNLVDFISKMGVKKISFLATQYEWSENHLSNLEMAAASEGAEVQVEWMGYGSEVDALDTVILKIKQQDPDLLFFEAGEEEVYAKLFSQLRQQNLNVPIITATPNLTRFMKNNPETVPGNDVYILVPALGDDFKDYFFAKTGEHATEYVEFAYDAVNIIVDAIQANSKENLKEYIKNNSFQGFSRSYTFDENHDAFSGEWVVQKDN